MKRYKMVVMVSCLLMSCTLTGGSGVQADGAHDVWSLVGYHASTAAQRILGKQGGLIVLTNAGYAQVNRQSTMAALDGVMQSTSVSPGAKTLVSVHSSIFSPLWFAYYDPSSGNCAYLEVNGDALKNVSNVGSLSTSSLFSTRAVMRIDPSYVMAHPEEFDKKSSEKIFGGNEFRIATIANAAASDAPDYVMAAITFHDHYCPGVTSGILMVNWLQTHFPPISGGSYFVHGVDPWCKEDALIALLNTTPGKKGYAVTYPTADDKATWRPDVRNASTIVYRQHPSTKEWEGVVLGFTFASNTGCETISSATVSRLCLDLWYLKRLDTPEAFVSSLATVTLPTGKTPQDLARPGVNVMRELRLTTE